RGAGAPALAVPPASASAASRASSPRSASSGSTRTASACGSRRRTPASRATRCDRTPASPCSRQSGSRSPSRRRTASSRCCGPSIPSAASWAREGEGVAMTAGASMKLGLAIKNFVGPSEQADMDALYAYAQRTEVLGSERRGAGGASMKLRLTIKNFVGPSEQPDMDALYAYAQRTEVLGFESLWAWDHVILGVEPAFPILDAVGTLTAIAARTSRIKLGTGVLVLPLRNPTVAAKALGTLDVISKGRLILGVAAGWYAREFDAVGVPFKRRGRLFERNFDILTRLWTDDRVSLLADEFNLREARLLPRPVPRPRPAILLRRLS